MGTTRAEYKLKMERQLLQWAANVAEIKLRIKMAGTDSKNSLKAELADLEMLEVSGKAHLADLEAVAAASWERRKTEMVDSWNKVAGSFDAVWARIGSHKA